MLTGGQGGEPYRVGVKPSMPDPAANIFESWKLLDLDVEFAGFFLARDRRAAWMSKSVSLMRRLASERSLPFFVTNTLSHR